MPRSRSLLNTNEETGSLGTRLLIENLARQHDATLNLEAGRPGDGLVIWRKGSGNIKVEVKGRAAHAGVAPDDGRNAAMELAHQLLQLDKLGNREKGTTVNFTVLKAGDRKTSFPITHWRRATYGPSAEEEFDRVERELVTISKNKLIPDTEVTTSLTRLFPIMPEGAQTRALVAMAQSIYGELGKMLELEGSGGAANFKLFGRRVQADAGRARPNRWQCPFARRVLRNRKHRTPVLFAHPYGDGARQIGNERAIVGHRSGPPKSPVATMTLVPNRWRCLPARKRSQRFSLIGNSLLKLPVDRNPLADRGSFSIARTRLDRGPHRRD